MGLEVDRYILSFFLPSVSMCEGEVWVWVCPSTPRRPYFFVVDANESTTPTCNRRQNFLTLFYLVSNDACQPPIVMVMKGRRPLSIERSGGWGMERAASWGKQQQEQQEEEEQEEEQWGMESAAWRQRQQWGRGRGRARCCWLRKRPPSCKRWGGCGRVSFFGCDCMALIAWH